MVTSRTVGLFAGAAADVCCPDWTPQPRGARHAATRKARARQRCIMVRLLSSRGLLRGDCAVLYRRAAPEIPAALQKVPAGIKSLPGRYITVGGSATARERSPWLHGRRPVARARPARPLRAGGG